MSDNRIWDEPAIRARSITGSVAYGMRLAAAYPDLSLAVGSVVEIMRGDDAPDQSPLPVIAPVVGLASPSPTPTRRMREIAREVRAKYRVSTQQFFAPGRSLWPARARQEFMWRVRRELPRLSLPQIGRFLGGRHHTTVMHGVRKHQARLDDGDLIECSPHRPRIA